MILLVLVLGQNNCRNCRISENKLYTHTELIDEQYRTIDAQAKVIMDSKHRTEALKKQIEYLNETLLELNKTNQELQAQIEAMLHDFQILMKKGESEHLPNGEGFIVSLKGKHHVHLCWIVCAQSCFSLAEIHMKPAEVTRLCPPKHILYGGCMCTRHVLWDPFHTVTHKASSSSHRCHYSTIYWHSLSFGNLPCWLLILTQPLFCDLG